MDAANSGAGAPTPGLFERARALVGRLPRKTLILLGSLLALGLAGLFLIWLLVGRGLPDAASLAKADRLLLHAEYLAFAHPENDEPLNFNCPAPF